jgi:hypothetical protein
LVGLFEAASNQVLQARSSSILFIKSVAYPPARIFTSYSADTDDLSRMHRLPLSGWKFPAVAAVSDFVYCKCSLDSAVSLAMRVSGGNCVTRLKAYYEVCRKGTITRQLYLALLPTKPAPGHWPTSAQRGLSRLIREHKSKPESTGRARSSWADFVLAQFL